MGRLDNKVAIVTGGNSGIGEATAKRFAAEGAQVVITARREMELLRVANEIAAAGGQCDYIPGDVTLTEDVENVVRRTIERFGRIDILVNNAGIGDRHTRTVNVTDTFWDEILDTDLKGVMRFCRAVLPHMEQAGKGSIVNVASIGGTYYCAGAAYSSAKAGVIALTKTTAVEFGSRNITVNAIAPGYIQTEMTEKLPQAARDAFLVNIPLKRGGLPSDVANAVCFFCTDESAYVTGQVLNVCGGMLRS